MTTIQPIAQLSGWVLVVTGRGGSTVEPPGVRTAPPPTDTGGAP